jgi:hypothetical protein
MTHGRGDYDRVKTGAIEQNAEISRAGHIGIKLAQMIQSLFVAIANKLQATVGDRAEIANQIRSPIPAANHTDIEFSVHVSFLS